MRNNLLLMHNNLLLPIQADFEAFIFYFILFFETLAFYTIFGEWLVYLTPNVGIAQVGTERTRRSRRRNQEVWNVATVH